MPPQFDFVIENPTISPRFVWTPSENMTLGWEKVDDRVLENGVHVVVVTDGTTTLKLTLGPAGN